MPTAPAASCALCIGRTHTSNNEYTGTPGIPARNGFNGFLRALPGDRALLPPSLAESAARARPVGPTCHPANLTPASGRQDHTTSPSAATSLVSVLCDRSRAHHPPCDPIARKTLPRPSHPAPTSVAIAKRPSWWDGIRKVLDVIWGVRKQKYFCKRDSTGKSQRRPTGKSVQSDGDAMKHCAVPRNCGDTITSEQTKLRLRLQMHRSRLRGQPA